MKTEVSSLISYAHSILYNEEEFPKYNTSLRKTIDKIQSLIVQHPHLEDDGKKAIQLLENQIQTNDCYVSKRKEETEAFSLLYCVRMQDLAGLKYLLRVGEDPNQVVVREKTIVQIVEKKGLKDFSQVIQRHFEALSNQQSQQNNLDSFEICNVTSSQEVFSE